MGEMILEILGVTGSSAVLILILVFLTRNWFLARIKNSIKYEYESDLRKLDNSLREKTESELAKMKSKLSLELEIAKIKMGPYSEKQFDTYNELWRSLCDLKYSMLQLWQDVLEEDFNDFSKKLDITTINLEKSALLIEDHHYKELMSILNEFASYQMGKRSILEWRRFQDKNYQVDQDALRKMINDNRKTKKRLLEYLPQMMNCLRSQISGKNNDAEQSTPADG